MNNDSNSFVKIFLSYRRDDVPDAVDRIADRLRERFGKDGVFVDISSIDAGKKWRDILTSAIEKCAALLIVIGPHWLRKVNGGEKLALDNPDDLVRKEITTALSRNISIIPILWGDAKFPSTQALPSEVRGMAEYQAFSIRRDHFESDIRLLLERVEAQVRMFASLGRRLGAFIIDLIPALIITSITGGNFWMFWGLFVVYHWLLVGFFGRTLGKLLMGIRVEFSGSSLEHDLFALARPLFGYPIMMFSGIGAIQFILHPQHVGIHDRLFHTQILQTRKLPWAAGLGRLDGVSYSFDEWLLKLLAGMGLGSLMQWAESFFGIDQPVKWVRNILKRFGGGKDPSAQVGVGIAGVGVFSVVAPPLIVGFLLTAVSLAIYEGVTPASLNIIRSGAPPAVAEPGQILPRDAKMPVDGCRAFFSGVIISDYSNYALPAISEAFVVDRHSEYVGAGSYDSVYDAFPKAIDSTFDAIAIDAGTRVEIFSEENFQGEKLLDITGPALITNKLWTSHPELVEPVTKEFKPELQRLFPPSARQWSQTDMHTWEEGSVRITCR